MKEYYIHVEVRDFSDKVIASMSEVTRSLDNDAILRASLNATRMLIEWSTDLKLERKG